MKVHVMVATTQGLVAIQKIYAQDPDIRSVVSINGTSTVSPISAAYHHFVKKGVGIIEADFGASSYRVNIDAAIDQGNSWQLAFYLAHAAHAQDLLGNGKPQAGDWVICATGELNTSEKTVLAVEQTALKIERAASKIAEWPSNITVHFILPKANENAANTAVIDQLKATQLVYVASLQQALVHLPTSNTNSLIKKPITTVSTNKQVNNKTKLTKYYLLLVLLALSLTIYLVVYNNKQLAGSLPWQNNTPAYDKIISSNGMQTNNSRPNKTLLRLAYSKADTCTKSSLSFQELVANNGAFAKAHHEQLCDIRLVSEQVFSTVLAINIKSHRFVQATKQQNAFVIPVPNSSADYLLIAFLSPIDSNTVKQIHAYLFNLSDDYVINDSDLRQLAILAGLEYQLFSHQLAG